MFDNDKKTKQFSAGHYHEMTTLELIKAYIISKLPKGKQSFKLDIDEPPPPPQSTQINHIAVVLDGVVEETIHCQNRLAALLLSNPQFIEYSEEDSPVVGSSKYVDGKFLHPEEPLMTDDQIKETLENMSVKKNEEN